jgi:hypothetical protein
MGKAEILRERLVEDAERVREMHPAVDLDVGALRDPPGGAGKIAEAIDRGDNGFLERRDMECR